MNRKKEKPVASGQKRRTRRDEAGEKEKLDPAGFRDYIVNGLNAAGSDVDAIWNFLDSGGSEVDYRRNGEALFDILIAGGLLVPGGSVAQEGDKLCKTNACIFEASDDMASMRNFEQVFVKLMRRYKYLKKMFVEEMKKVLMFIKGFNESERIKLARMTALWIANGSILPQVLTVLLNEHLVKDGLALDFLIEIFVTWKQEKGLTSMMASLKKSGMERNLMEFVPPNKRTEDYFKKVLKEKGLDDVSELLLAQERQTATSDLEKYLSCKLAENFPIDEITSGVREMAVKAKIPSHEVVKLVWNVLMHRAVWMEAKPLTPQAVNYLKKFTVMLKTFTPNDEAELNLMLAVQKTCNDNMNFMKAFQKVIRLFYNAEIISASTIMKWFEEPCNENYIFFEQMEQFRKSLKTAKKNEKEKLDPAGFRDYIVIGLNAAGSDVDAIWNFLDSAGSEVDYRRNGEALFDILIAGGLLGSDGSITDITVEMANTCIFKASQEMAVLRDFELVFVKLMRRYKYLEKMFVEGMKKVLMFIKGFNESERIKLARMTALWIANGSILPQVLTVLLNEEKDLVKNGLALNFLLEVLTTWNSEKVLPKMIALLKKSPLARNFLDFVPPAQRNEEYFIAVLKGKGLHQVVELHLAERDVDYCPGEYESEETGREELSYSAALIRLGHLEQDLEHLASVQPM